MLADLTLDSQRHICPSENNIKELTSHLVAKVGRDVSPQKSVGNFRPSEQIFPEANRWVPLSKENVCGDFSAYVF